MRIKVKPTYIQYIWEGVRGRDARARSCTGWLLRRGRTTGPYGEHTASSRLSAPVPSLSLSLSFRGFNLPARQTTVQKKSGNLPNFSARVSVSAIKRFYICADVAASARDVWGSALGRDHLDASLCETEDVTSVILTVSMCLEPLNFNHMK